MRTKADGSGEPEVLKSGKFKKGKNTYAYWIRQPVVSPDGVTVAVISDAPNPDDKTLTRRSSTAWSRTRSATPAWPTNGSLGHQDPDWRPDGKFLLYVKNGRDGSRGAPVIMRYNAETEKAAPADRLRLPLAVVLTRRQVHRRDPDLGVRDRRRHPRRGDRRGAPAGHRRRRLVGAGLVARRAMASRSCTSTARPSTCDWPSSTATPRTGPSPTPSTLTEVSDLEPASRPGLVHPRRPAARHCRTPAAGGPARPAVRQRGSVTATYLERLAARSAATGTVLCLGLDPDPAALPDGFSRTSAGIEAFAGLVLEAAVPYAAAVKPNLAFFEAYGSPGMAALERLRARIPADVPVIADAKRGDIGTTAARQAVALFDALGADAVTVNPYLGERGDRAAPRAPRPLRVRPVPDVQPRRRRAPGPARRRGPATGAPAEPLHARVARRAASWGPGGTVGLVVGATAPEELARDPGDRAGPGVPRARCRRPGRRHRGGPRGRPGDGRAGRPATRWRTAGQRLARHRRRRLRDGASGGPRRGHRDGRRRLGGTTPCATLADRETPV